MENVFERKFKHYVLSVGLCRESFEDDTEATEEDIDSELGVIR